MLRWRDGTEPCGGAYRSLVRVARWVPGGPRPDRRRGFPGITSGGVGPCPVNAPITERPSTSSPRTSPEGWSGSREASGLTLAGDRPASGDQHPHPPAVAGRSPAKLQALPGAAGVGPGARSRPSLPPGQRRLRRLPEQADRRCVELAPKLALLSPFTSADCNPSPRRIETCPPTGKTAIPSKGFLDEPPYKGMHRRTPL